MKPVDWPRYMLAKRVRGGEVRYYWSPHRRDLDAGCSVKREALGSDYGEAIKRADFLNAYLDAWRQGAGAVKEDRRHGTVSWLVKTYFRSPAFARVSERSRLEYRRALARIEDIATLRGGRVGDLPASSISPLAVDKIYAKLQHGPRGPRVRQANISLDIARRAWAVVRRTHPALVPFENPWRGVLRLSRRSAKPAATRAETYALATALRDLGEPHLGAAAIICFELLQRPENVLDGGICWSDYRPKNRPSHIRVGHHKTGVTVWMPLEDDRGLLFPEMEGYLQQLPRLGLPIVLTSGQRGPSRPYSHEFAQRRVREARTVAGLGRHVTLDACRHGGMTELGNAALTEQGVMTLSGHRTPDAARLYIKRTEEQRLRAIRMRRTWIEENERDAEVRMDGQMKSQNNQTGETK